MTDFNPTGRVAVTDRVPTDDRAASPRIAVAPRAPMTTTGPLVSSQDVAAGIVAAVMLLGPLAMAAFSVGRY
jgi:hypothetical protein